MLSRLSLLALVFLLSLAPVTFAAEPSSSRSTPCSPPRCSDKNTAVAEYDELIRQTRERQPELAEALRLFPKGGDLHNHLSGAIMPEDYLALAISEGDCYSAENQDHPEVKTLSPGPVCSYPAQPVAAADEKERENILKSLSMYQFPYPDIQSGHDQFFATFPRFSAVSNAARNGGPMLGRLLRQASRDGVSYVEIMTSFQSAAVTSLGALLHRKYPNLSDYNDANFPAMYDYLVGLGLEATAAAARDEVAAYLGSAQAALRCGLGEAEAACRIRYGFLASVKRDAALPDKKTPDQAKIFAQSALSFLLAARDARVVGVNLLSGEDSPVSMAAFATEMKIFSYLHRKFPRVNIALHAGEIIPCLLPAGGTQDDPLKSHLTGSLEAGAKRIGHGVSFHYLDPGAKRKVSEAFRKNGAVVEIMFTSNAQILGVTGDHHPFRDYRSYGVPIAFSTDDEGVSHSDYTREWIYGYKRYGLKPEDLKLLARQSLQHSFLPGAPLWSGLPGGELAPDCAGSLPAAARPSESCRSFLENNPKAKLQWEYEVELGNYLKAEGGRYRRLLEENSGTK
jgi:adenosine deaminase